MSGEGVESGSLDDASGPAVEVAAPTPVPVGSPRGRHALDYLLQHRSADLSAIADHVAAMESGRTPAELSAFERRLVATSLRRVHLPALDRRGLISWDPERRRATLPGPSRWRPGRHGGPARWYLGLALAQVAAVALAVLDVPPFAGVEPLAAVTVVMALVFVTAAAQLLLGLRRRARA
jgi:hypothetical protein